MASSSIPDFLLSSNCSHCSKMEMKQFHCPALSGGGGGHNNHYNDFPGFHVHPQLINRSPCQCCPGNYQPMCPAFPVPLDRPSCNCPRCRSTQENNIERRVPLLHHPHMFPCGSQWQSPVEVQNTALHNAGFVPTALPGQPCIPGHVGMTAMGQVDNNLPINPMSLSYHHHHHYHHYHYHPHSRNNIHPYALPVFHPRLRRQPSSHRTSRQNADENHLPHNLLSILSPVGRVTWQGGLDTEQLEHAVNFGEQLVDQKPRGLSKATVENLPSYRITSKDKNDGESRCVICLMDFEEKHQVRILPCSHEYHSKCIDKWLKLKLPDMTSSNEEYLKQETKEN